MMQCSAKHCITAATMHFGIHPPLDMILQESDMPKIQMFCPNSTLKWIDAGHLVQLEKPAEFISMVVEFLR